MDDVVHIIDRRLSNAARRALRRFQRPDFYGEQLSMVRAWGGEELARLAQANLLLFLSFKVSDKEKEPPKAQQTWFGQYNLSLSGVNSLHSNPKHRMRGSFHLLGG